jgi:ATP phosphoribosyltransferase regulatory subunit
MTLTQRWLLPEGIDEVAPEDAARLEQLRRELIDRLQTWGYQLVTPPLVEYLDALLTGPAKMLELQTFKLIDEMSGRLLGIRADMTPQVARIAAHKLRDKQEVLRLCYIGNVLKTLPVCQGTSRNPTQLGAEIYGHSGAESDMEILQLMIEALGIIGFEKEIVLDIGHVGIFGGLAEQANLNDEQEHALFVALQRKALPEIAELLTQYQLDANSHDMLLALAELNGGTDVLHKAQHTLAKASASVLSALESLQTVAKMAAKRLPNVAINFDLAELRGYDYHTGMVFAAYQAGSAHALAMGGRYDGIGEDFGHSQPATGFSLDLKEMVANSRAASEQQQAISVVWQDDVEQHKTVEQLRSQGDVVVYQLSGTEVTANKALVKQNNHWVVVETGTDSRG